MTEHPSLDGTRLTTEAYAAHLTADVDALIAASADLEPPVPGCPDWNVRDLISHLVGVYRHKVAAIDADAAPPQLESPRAWGDIDEGDDPREVLRTAYAELRERLESRGPDSVTWTWWPPEQTVGFWVRRMAQETAVHRWDAESAARGVDDAGEIDAALAADGVDELLGWLTWPWDEMPQDEATGQKVLVSSGEHSWTVTLHQTRVEVAGGGDDAAVSLLAAEPSGLLLHLWGRPGEHGVATGGDEVALRLLHERLAALAS